MKPRRSLWVAALAVLLLAGSQRLSAAGDHTTATLAHIKLSGSLSEAPTSSDPLFGIVSENFKTKLDRIRQAKQDDAIKGLFLEIEDLNVGWGKLDELRKTVVDFRKSGKKAYAYMESGSTKDYLLAIACDEVCVPESGWLMLTGVRAEVSFYKDLFDKLGVKADLLQMGDYKSAAEPFTRTSLSKESRSQLEKVLDDFYDNELVGRISEARSEQGHKLSKDEVRRLIDEGPYTAQAAAKAGLIDHVAYAEGFQEELKTPLKVDRVKVSRNYGQAKAEELKLTSPFDLFKLFAGSKTTTSSSKPKVAVIYATGAIVVGKGGDSLLGGEVCGSTTIIEAIRQAEKDDTVKAIVLRVDSPGGSALASDLIWNELRRCKKPVVASMSDVAASGGYYISMGAQKVYAEPGTLTGSIGVFGGKLTLGGLFEKVGINTEVITRGEHADMFSTTKPFSDSERKALRALMRDAYDQFLDKTVENRKRAGKELDRQTLEKDLAGGRVWTGRQAKENGLVDELGTLNDAVAEAKKLGHMGGQGEPELLLLPKPRTFLDRLMEMDEESLAPPASLRQLPLLRQLPELNGKLDTLEGLLQLRGEPAWLLAPYRVEIR